MSFYQLMSTRYGNRRTFSPETEGGAGGAGAGDDAAAAAADDAGAAAAADPAPADASVAAAGDADPAKAAPVNPADAPKTDDEKASLLREVMDKKTKLKDAETRLKEFDGIDPAKYRDLVAKEAAAEQAAAEAKGDFDRVKQMMADAHKTEKAGLEAQVADLQAQLASKDTVIDELTVGSAFSTSSFIRDSLVPSPTQARKLYGDFVSSEGGVVVVYDKPATDTTRTKLVDGSGNPLPFDAALAKIIEADPDKKSVLRAKAKPGAGSTTTPAASATPKAGEGLYGVSRLAATLGE